jgi:dTMP kinase
MTPAGRLITFEGGEGAGKSTQLARLAAALRAAGGTVVTTREPGGTPAAEAVRALLIGGGPERWTPMSETLLVQAARHDHVARLIAPALAAGQWVLCDRFSDSTRVYQGIAGELGLDLIDRLHRAVFGDLLPDLTLILDLPAAAGLARRQAAQSGNRFEQKPRAYHERVRAGFLAIARAEPARCVLIDADRPEDAVADSVRAAVSLRFDLALTGGQGAGA